MLALVLYVHKGIPKYFDWNLTFLSLTKFDSLQFAQCYIEKKE